MHLPDFLEGAVDLHVHSAPDVDPRRFNDIELAQEAARAGMSGVLLKSHQTSTAERAWLVSRIVAGIAVYGGITLNTPVGGWNPDAVRVALQLGAREVWLPTRSARNHRVHHGLAGGLTVTGPDGQLLPEILQIFDLIAKAECILGTGHLSPEEVMLLVPAAQRAGVNRILITHPEWNVTFYPIAQQLQLARSSGVFFERCFVSTTHRCGYVPFSTIENAIAEVGVESTILSTDLGQPDTPPPAEGLRLYAERLISSGFNPDQLRLMMQTNPHRLITKVAHAA
jgi:hypothetical protein